MECMKEGTICSLCDSSKDLYASQCVHLDPICLKCATTKAKNKETCATCGQLITKVIRRYELKPCQRQREIFVGKFPVRSSRPPGARVEQEAGDGNLKSGDGHLKRGDENKYFQKKDKQKWIMHKDCCPKTKLKGNKPWILKNTVDEIQYSGKKQINSKNYFMVVYDARKMLDKFAVSPITSWYDFQKDIRYATLTLEEAEKEMQDKKRNQEGYGRWMMKDKKEKVERGVKTRLVIDEDNDDDEGDVDENILDDEDNEEAKRKRKKNQEEEEEEEEEEKVKPHPNNDADEDQEKDKGEEWEHEHEYADDDEQLIADSPHSSKESESDESLPDIISDDENEVNITEAEKEMKRLIKKNFDEKDESEKEREPENKKDDQDESKHKDEDVEMPDSKSQDPPKKNQTKEHRGNKRKPIEDDGSRKKTKGEVSLEKQWLEFLQTGPKSKEEMTQFFNHISKKDEGIREQSKIILKKISKIKGSRYILKR